MRALTLALPEGEGMKPAGEGAKAPSREDCKRALDEALLERLVALNTERAAEEKRGHIRWLRPEFQIPALGKPQAPQPEQMYSGLLSDWRTAGFFAGNTYTTVGYGNFLLPLGWKMLAPIIAISGLFTFGWSGSVLVDLVARCRKIKDAAGAG